MSIRFNSSVAMGKRHDEDASDSLASQIDSYCNRSGGIEVLTDVARKLHAARENKEVHFTHDITLHHATRLLAVYKASLSTEDQLILFILRSLQDVCGIDFDRLSPVVFGERAETTYGDLKRLGEALYSRATSNDVLNQLSAQGLWYAMLQWPLHMKNERSLEELEVRNRFVGALKSIPNALASTCAYFAEQQRRKC